MSKSRPDEERTCETERETSLGSPLFSHTSVNLARIGIAFFSELDILEKIWKVSGVYVEKRFFYSIYKI